MSERTNEQYWNKNPSTWTRILFEAQAHQHGSGHSPRFVIARWCARGRIRSRSNSNSATATATLAHFLCGGKLIVTGRVATFALDSFTPTAAHGHRSGLTNDLPPGGLPASYSPPDVVDSVFRYQTVYNYVLATCTNTETQYIVRSGRPHHLA